MSRAERYGLLGLRLSSGAQTRISWGEDVNRMRITLLSNVSEQERYCGVPMQSEVVEAGYSVDRSFCS